MCGGRGEVAGAVCHVCQGQGAVLRSRRLEVKIPAGAHDGTRVRLATRAARALGGGPRGDLYVVVHVRTHPRFERKRRRPRHRGARAARGRGARWRGRGADGCRQAYRHQDAAADSERPHDPSRRPRHAEAGRESQGARRPAGQGARRACRRSFRTESASCSSPSARDGPSATRRAKRRCPRDDTGTRSQEPGASRERRAGRLLIRRFERRRACRSRGRARRDRRCEASAQSGSRSTA